MSTGDGSAAALNRLRARIIELEAEIEELRKERGDPETAAQADFVAAATGSLGLIVT